MAISQNVDIQILNFVAEALNVKAETLQTQKMTAFLMALFDTTPKAARGVVGMIVARVLLAWCLLETLGRGETDKAIDHNPEVAGEVLPYLLRFREWLDRMITRCEKAAEKANSQQPE